MATLLRIDKNGTKYWEETKCPRCGGTGYVDYYRTVFNGECFLCGGTGYHKTITKEYTPEYLQAKAERNLNKRKARADKVNKDFIKRLGFSEDGKAWFVLGDTYRIKDELKSEGASFAMGNWHYDHDPEWLETIVIDIKDITWCDEAGWLQPNSNVEVQIDDIIEEANKKVSKSDWVGEVGDKITLQLTCDGYFSYETMYGTQRIFKFTDGTNEFVWKTASFPDIYDGETYTIQATIKAHSTYKDVKQTELTRVKVK